VKLEGFKDGESATATMLGIFILGVSNEGPTREVGVEMTVSASTNQTVTNRGHA
jgi:hypothetical protein